MATYKIIRKFLNADSEIIDEGLTLEEAREHCNNKETSYKTCKSRQGIKRTKDFGPWFDIYTEE